MDTVIINLHWERGVPKPLVEQVIDFFERHPGPIKAKAGRGGIVCEKNADGEILWNAAFDQLSDLREQCNVPTEEFQFLITQSPNEGNYFAVENEDNMRDAFGHADDFTWFTTAPTFVIISHYILKAICNAFLVENAIDLDEIWHMDETLGCFNNFCATKPDLNFKLRTGDICGDCLEQFQSVPEIERILPQLVSLMENSRTSAINTGIYLKREDAFQRWPFPVAITRHRIVNIRQPLHRLLRLLDHFDCLTRYFYLAFLVWSEEMPDIPERPSLGWWVDQLSKKLKSSRQDNLRAITRIAERENIVQIRNEKRAHGWTAPNDDLYERDSRQLESAIREIEEKMEPFFRQFLAVIPREIELVGGKLWISGEQLIGSHTIHPAFEIEAPMETGRVPTDFHRVFLVDHDSARFRPMHPYLREENCPQCGTRRLLITDGGNCYIDVEMGHRVYLT